MKGLLYGTAWKEERTTDCVLRAIKAGFRAIDTANQRKHYFEAGVGEAVAKCGVPRNELFLQTKFTFVEGQDERLPYDKNAPTTEQVASSIKQSLVHLQTDYIDSVILHGPSQSEGLGQRDIDAYQALETAKREGVVREIGVSNISLSQLKQLCTFAKHPPAYVQNRCYARTGFDADVRAFCAKNESVYQGFSLLTANRAELGSPIVLATAKRLELTVPQLVFAFSRQIGMWPMTGTTNSEHMKQDLASLSVVLEEDVIGMLQTLILI